MYIRTLEKPLKEKLFAGKAIILVGPRQVGKTTLMLELAKEQSARFFNCDNPTDRELLENKDLVFLQGLVDDVGIILIDEAQKANNIGQSIKLLVDHYKNNKQIIATGSSSINLLDNTQEPLTGRKFVYRLFPLSITEIHDNKLDMLKRLDELLIYGSYPEVAMLATFAQKRDALKELSTSYLYKDILEHQQIKNSDVLFKLLKALALQLGSEVSYNELANLLGIDKKTVERYIILLEQCYVIFRLPPFKHNKRRTISKLNKIYFYDLGIRNAIINNFNMLDSRNDTGALFENLCVVERMKLREYHSIYANHYFFRTYDGAEVDLIEEREGKHFAYEFKLTRGRKKPQQDWDEYQEVNRDNLWEFLQEGIDK